jgi:hypothetical protein
MRVVTQLALVPAPPTWSQAYRRKSVEHPLEQERLRERRELGRAQASDPGTFQLIGLGVLVALQTPTRWAGSFLVVASRLIILAWKDAEAFLRSSGRPGARRDRGTGGAVLSRLPYNITDQEP